MSFESGLLAPATAVRRHVREQNADLEKRLAAVEDHLGLGDSVTTDRGVADD